MKQRFTVGHLASGGVEASVSRGTVVSAEPPPNPA
jgi:hypothetical protein